MTSNTTFTRWTAGESRRGHVLGRLQDDHPAAYAFCVIGGEKIGTQEPVQLLVIGPTDAVDRDDHEAGNEYLAGALVVHKRCLDELDDNVVENLVKGMYTYIEDTW